MTDNQPHVDWAEIARLEKDIYGEIVSPEIKEVVHPPELNPFQPAMIQTPTYTGERAIDMLRQAGLDMYQCSGHYHRKIDDMMINPFTYDILPDQWCKGRSLA